jgi:DNA-binding transcriptional LysR family regulator
MEMHQVRYFLAVAETLNFTRAAEKCHVAQPSLTRAIKLLEAELGGPLFHRERLNTHLSELGHMVKPHLEQVYAQSLAARSAAQSFAKADRVSLRLGVMCTIAPDKLIELVSTLHARYRHIDFEIVDAAGRELHERLIAGDLEVAVYCRPGLEPEERLHEMPLFAEQMMIVIPPDHRLARQNMVELEHLDGEHYLERVNCEFGLLLDRMFTERGVNDTTVYRSERDDWILAMVASGLGYAFMPEGCVKHAQVVARPLVNPEIWREVSLVTVRGRPHSPGVGALVREAMRLRWNGGPALSVARLHVEAAGEEA